MKKLTVLVGVAALCIACPVHAEWAGGPGGTWPKSWPAELDPLRKQAWTWEHSLAGPTIYEIRFPDRDAFESAWPHLLKLKSQGASITLLRGPNRKLGKPVTAGVRMLTPGRPITPAEAGGLPVRTQTDIELIVDGEIVNLNRIPLPAETPIIDKRFEGGHNLSLNRSGS